MKLSCANYYATTMQSTTTVLILLLGEAKCQEMHLSNLSGAKSGSEATVTSVGSEATVTSVNARLAHNPAAQANQGIVRDGRRAVRTRLIQPFKRGPRLQPAGRPNRARLQLS